MIEKHVFVAPMLHITFAMNCAPFNKANILKCFVGNRFSTTVLNIEKHDSEKKSILGNIQTVANRSQYTSLKF